MALRFLAQANTFSEDKLGVAGRVALVGIGGFVAAEPVMEMVNVNIRKVEHTPVSMTTKLVGAALAVGAVELILRYGGGVDLELAYQYALRDAANIAASVLAMPDGELKNKALAGWALAYDGASPKQTVDAAVAAKLRKAA